MTGPLSPPRRGRPRKTQPGGHNLGHSEGLSLEVSKNMGGNGDKQSALASLAVAPLSPRLLDLHAAALYLGVSEWTVRDLEAGGSLRRIRLPLPAGGEVRKLLFALEDLDQLVNNSRDSDHG